MKPDPRRVAARQMQKQAGEVRFIKDKSNSAQEWAFDDGGVSERKISPQFAFSAKNLKPLAKVLRGTMSSLGFAMSAYNVFAKLKSSMISPDGALGGKGYVQKVSHMRRQYMNVVEALSSLSDTLYDELKAPHWDAAEQQEDPREREEVRDIIEDAEEIREDPEGWAEEEEEEMDDEHEAPEKKGKTASVCPRVTSRRNAFLQSKKAGEV